MGADLSISNDTTTVSSKFINALDTNKKLIADKKAIEQKIIDAMKNTKNTYAGSIKDFEALYKEAMEEQKKITEAMLKQLKEMEDKQ